MAVAARVVEVDLHGGFDPLPTQLAFSSSSFRNSAYIGPFGSGKSEILCRTCIDLAVKVPGNRGLIGRYTYRDYTRTTAETMARVLIPDVVEKELAGGDGWILRTSDPDKPSQLLTAHFDDESAFTSMGLGFYGIDEVNGSETAPAVPERVWRVLNARLGRDVPQVKNPRGLVVGNPGGHNYIWKFHHAESPGRLREAMMFCPTPYENANNLPVGYYERLERDNGPEWVARYVKGSHEVFEGQIYPELDEKQHTVDAFSIPPTWPRVISLDHGLQNPTCVIFGAINEDGVIFLYDEHYEAGRVVSYHAAQIKKRLTAMNQARAIDWPADPSIFAKSLQADGRIYSIFDEYDEAGLDRWIPGENAISAGRNRIKEYLKAGKLKFFRGRLPNVWREMVGLHWRRFRSLVDKDPPEEEADIDNHGPDALRYLVMSRPDPAQRPKEPMKLSEADERARRASRIAKAALARARGKLHGADEDFT